MQSSSASNDPPTGAAPGLTLAGGRYRLLRQLGRGGYGRVWLAEDCVLGVEVAVKEVAVPPGSAAGVTAEMIERATLEARNAARLRDHPNIVTVHDVLVERATPWTVMQYVPGRSLADEVDLHGPVPVPTAQRVAASMLSALSACHEAGVIHRDVKPHNIMLAEDGTPMLTDFGIAKATGQATMTETGMVAGTVAYIAPERAKGEPGTSASDLFSLGVTLYHAVEGLSPFDRGSGMATLAAVLLDNLPEPVRAGPLAPAIQGLTAKDPDLRLTAEQATALLTGPPPEREADGFDVILQDAGHKKIQVIKVVREVVPGLGLKEAKELVDGAPQTILRTASRQTADEAKRKLEAVGATIALTQGTGKPPERTREYATAMPPADATSKRVDQSVTASSKRNGKDIVGGLVVACVIAGIFFLPKLFSSTPPSDASDLSSAHVGDCAATTNGNPLYLSAEQVEVNYRKVPCWHGSAAYHVLEIGAQGATWSEEADRQVCQGVPGWDAGVAVKVRNSSLTGTLIYCLGHK
jgi:ribosomal protein L7/L12